MNHNFEKIKIDSYNSLPIKNMLIFHNVIILIKLAINKSENKYYYNIFSERAPIKYIIFVYYECYIMIQKTFLKELMLIKQTHQKSIMFVTINIY